MFADESDDVRRKADACNQPRSQATTPTRLTESSTSYSFQAQSDLATPYMPPDDSSYLSNPVDVLSTYCPTPSLDQHAQGFFFTNYVLNSTSPTYDDLDANLSNCLKAVGVAGIASTNRSSTMDREASKRYIIALRSTNMALRSSVETRKDSTLLAVLLLSMFETVDRNTPRPMLSWTEHVKGAALMLSLRGATQFRTLAGFRMFVQAAYCYTHTCIAQKIHVPQELNALVKEGAKHVSVKDPTWKLLEAMVLYADLAASIADSTLNNHKVVIEKSLDIDAKARAVMSETNEDWAYEILPTQFNSWVFYLDHYHTYPTYLAVTTWNSIRQLRLMLHMTIVHFIRPISASSQPAVLSPDQLDQLSSSHEILKEMQSEVIATVPQLFGYGTASGPTKQSMCKFPWSNFRSVTNNPTRSTGVSKLPPIRTAGGYTAFPYTLYVAGLADVTSSRLKSWIIKILYEINVVFGVAMASRLAGILEVS